MGMGYLSCCNIVHTLRDPMDFLVWSNSLETVRCSEIVKPVILIYWCLLKYVGVSKVCVDYERKCRILLGQCLIYGLRFCMKVVEF